MFVTHDQTEALAVGDRVAVLRDGRVQQVATPEGIYGRPANRFVASLMGEAGFLPVWEEGDELVTELGSAERSDADAGVAAAELVAVIRPNTVELVADVQGSAVVTAVEFRGPDEGVHGATALRWRAPRVGRRSAGAPGGRHGDPQALGELRAGDGQGMSVRSGEATRVGLVDDLAVHHDRPALFDGDDVLTYAELDERVRHVADRLGTTRRLVAIEAATTIDSVVAYLAALRGRHPVLMLAPGGDLAAELLRTYQPDVVVGSMTQWHIEERRPGTAHDLHPQLALLMSTSGSTGSAKLVRLSSDSVQANAASIAAYLGLTPEDRAITTLPLHYCYGLSVLNSHLAVGASVVLNDLSVVDRVLLGALPGDRRDELRWRPVHVRDARQRGVRGDDPAVAPLHHAGGRPDGPRTRPPLCDARTAGRLGSLRDVRPDRGDRPDGVPPAAPRGRPAGGDRSSDPRRGAVDRARRRGRTAGRRRRDRVSRAQRDARLRDVECRSRPRA